jgi:tetratricopeptide (TPR) repeat protein
MVKRYKKYLIAALSSFVCLKMSHAQSDDIPSPPLAPAVNTVPSPTPAAPPVLPNPSVPAVRSTVVDPSAILNVDNTVTGKFEEHLSICRNREYDKLKYQSAQLFQAKQKTIAEQTDQLIKGGIANLDQAFDLLKEQIDYDNIKDFYILSTALKQKKLSVVDLNKLNGFISYSKNNFRESETYFQKILNDDKHRNDEFVLKVMGEVYLASGNFFEATSIYEDLNKVKSNKYLPEMCEAMVMNSLNSDGETICLMATRIAPKSPYPLIYAGISHRERQNFKRARDLFIRANNLKATEMGNVCIAELSMLDNKFDDAVKYFKLSVIQSPLSPRAVLGLAWAQMKALNYKDAIETFRQACRINPRYEVEIRKAYKKLVDDKSPEADKFMKVATNCSY